MHTCMQVLPKHMLRMYKHIHAHAHGMHTHGRTCRNRISSRLCMRNEYKFAQSRWRALRHCCEVYDAYNAPVHACIHRTYSEVNCDKVGKVHLVLFLYVLL